MPISSFSNPIPEIIDGLLRGQEMGMRMRAAQRADQEFKTQQAMHNQQMSMQDIMNQQNLQQMGRPVSAMGTVDSPSLSSALLQPSGSVSAPMSNAAPTPTPDGNAPTLSPAQLPKAMPGMGDQQSSMPGYTRKADKSRTVTYTDRFGNKTSSELYTPEEQQQRALAQQTAQYGAQERAKTQAQIDAMGPLADAQARNQLTTEGLVRKLHLAAENGGTPAPPEIAPLIGKHPGEPILASELNQGRELLNRTQVEGLGLRKGGLEVEEMQRKIDLLKNANPQDYLSLVDQVAPLQNNGALNKRTKAQVSAALKRGDFAGAQDAIKQASAEVRQLEVATDPRVAANKVQIALQTQAGKAAADADAAGLTPDDYSRAGEQYARTGVMPSVGRDKTTRAKIMHASSEWARDNGLSPKDMVTMQAAYAGDKDSLKKFQAQRDQIVSFEGTAQKNLDLFLNAAAQIPDVGSPWINKPLRDLNEKLLGSVNMAAVNAARQVANNEIAKVTSGGGLGGVLSDSARHEVESYNPKNATFAQTVAVAKILKQDMANRHDSMDATLGDIRARIGGGGGIQQPAFQQPTVPQSTGGGRGTPAGGGQQTFDVTDPRGVVHHFTSQQDATTFKQAAGIR